MTRDTYIHTYTHIYVYIYMCMYISYTLEFFITGYGGWNMMVKSWAEELKQTTRQQQNSQLT